MNSCTKSDYLEGYPPSPARNMEILQPWLHENWMNGLISCIGGHFDLVEYQKRYMVVASTMVRVEVNFLQETLLDKLKSRRKQVPVYRFSMDTLGWQDKWGLLERIQAQQGQESLRVDFGSPVYIPSLAIWIIRWWEACPYRWWMNWALRLRLMLIILGERGWCRPLGCDW